MGSGQSGMRERPKAPSHLLLCCFAAFTPHCPLPTAHWPTPYHPAMPADQLNDAQRLAVDHDAGPLIVLAGPGTGKTRVIIARLARLLESGAPPESLLALTFSVKAAEQMRERLAGHIGLIPAQRLTISTFHAFGRQITRRFSDMLGLRPDADLLDSAMKRRILRRLIADHNLFPNRRAVGHEAIISRVDRFITDCRNAGRLPEDALAHARVLADRIAADAAPLIADPDALTARTIAAEDFAQCAHAYELFDRACRDEGCFTFDDLLTLPLRLFRDSPAAAAIIRDEYRHILVDEFQDVNPAQIELLRAIAPPMLPSGRAPDLCVVGDDDQAIYGFRGSDPHAFTRFTEIWTDHHVQPLTINYRSAPDIIKAGNAVISRASDRFAPDKTIEPAPARLGQQGGVEGVVLPDDRITGQVIAAMIEHDRSNHPERRLGSYAVIASANNTLDQIAAEMELAGIPIVIRRTITALEDQGVQDLLAWVRLLLDQDSIADAQRLLIRPPTLVSMTDVQLWAAAYRKTDQAHHGQGFADWIIERHTQHQGVRRFAAFLHGFRKLVLSEPADRIIDTIVRAVDIAHAEALAPRPRAARVARLVQVLRFVRSRQPFLEPPGDLASFWRYYNDLDDTEQEFNTAGEGGIDSPESLLDEDDRDDAVQLLTAHKSKGLEFDTVFIAKVRPRGFPGVGRADDHEPLPEDFSSIRARELADEQRRLFYVACTRAEKRLVLLAKAKKTRGKAVDYFDELTQDEIGLSIPISQGADWLARTGAPLDDDLAAAASPAADEDRRARIIQREASLIRQEAYAALHDASITAHADIADVESRLVRAAHLIAGLSALEARAELPAFIAADAPEARRLAHIAERLERQESRITFAAPVPPPLRLSYSRINDYTDCPRCYYLKYIMGYEGPRSDALTVGDAVHRSIEQYLKECAAAEADGRSPPGPERLLAISDTIARIASARTAVPDDATLDQIRAQLRNYADHFHDNAELFKTEGVVTFNYSHNGIAHPFTAKIDRVDRLPDGSWRIADYKTGKATKRLLQPDADDLQMCIYAMALPHLLDPDALEDADAPGGRAEYWLLSTTDRGTIAFDALSLDKARKVIDAAITGMLQGHWPKGKGCHGHCTRLWPDE